MATGMPQTSLLENGDLGEEDWCHRDDKATGE